MHLQLNVTAVFPASFKEDEHFLNKKKTHTHITGAGVRYYLYAFLQTFFLLLLPQDFAIFVKPTALFYVIITV
jgi:membrane glycosyltransferase